MPARGSKVWPENVTFPAASTTNPLTEYGRASPTKVDQSICDPWASNFAMYPVCVGEKNPCSGRRSGSACAVVVPPTKMFPSASDPMALTPVADSPPKRVAHRIDKSGASLAKYASTGGLYTSCPSAGRLGSQNLEPVWNALEDVMAPIWAVPPARRLPAASNANAAGLNPAIIVDAVVWPNTLNSQMRPSTVATATAPPFAALTT